MGRTWLAVLAGLLASRTAAATEPSVPPTPDCNVETAPNGDQSQVPSNAPAVIVRANPFRATFALSSVELDGPEPITTALTRDPEVPDQYLVVLSHELVAQSVYTLTYASRCTADDGSEVRATSVQPSFRAGPATSLPTSVGTVTVKQARSGSPLTTTLALTLTPELTAYLPVTRFTLVSDGHAWSPSKYGALSTEGASATLDYTVDTGCFSSSSTLCIMELDSPTPSPTSQGGVCTTTSTAQWVQFELHAHVAGAASDPTPLAFEAPIDCSGGTPPSSASSSRTLHPGCRIGPEGAPLPWAGLVAAVGLGLALRRSRRAAGGGRMTPFRCEWNSRPSRFSHPTGCR
jgi:hypothetical protein